MGFFGSQLETKQDNYTKLLLHFSDDTMDSSDYGYNFIRTAGTVSISTTFSKFGNGSIFFRSLGSGPSGNGVNVISASDSNDWFLGTQSFTIDFWASVPDNSTWDGGGTAIIGQRVDANNFWHVNVLPHSASGKIKGGFNSLRGGVYDIALDHTNGATWSSGTTSWYHFATVRSGNTWYQFVNGELQTNTLVLGSYNCNMSNLAAPLSLQTYGAWHQHGPIYIDEIRISIGVARWTSSFTPERNPY